MIKNLSFFAKKTQRYFSSVNVYTWGRTTQSLGYATPQQVMETVIPKKIDADFDSDPIKCRMGLYHSAIITKNGNLYTFGNGGSGMLGHNDGEKNHIQPKLVEFFAKNNLKVVDVQLGEAHTIALTDDGDVWSWGYGGRVQNFLMDMFFSSIGATGHPGKTQNRFTPYPIQTLRQLPPVKQISSGYYFSMSLNEKNELYNWGRGDYGVFGDGNNKNFATPQLNTYFELLKDQNDGLRIIKLKSANNYSIALMSDGNLYGWGSNESGQMGIKTEIGVEMYETAMYPVETINTEFKGKKILDFDISEDTLVILLENNDVYWSGMKLEYQPTKLKLDPNIGKIKKVSCCFRSLCVLTEDNKVFMKNAFVKHQHENIETGILTTDNSIFDGGNILDIGGKYRNRFAIVQNNQ